MESSFAADSSGVGKGSKRSRKATEGWTCKGRCSEDQISAVNIREIQGAPAGKKRASLGNIDYDFYHDRAMNLRSEQFVTVGKIIMRFLSEVSKTLAHVRNLSV